MPGEYPIRVFKKTITYVCVCIYTYTHTHTHTHIYVCTHVFYNNNKVRNVRLDTVGDQNCILSQISVFHVMFLTFADQTHL